MRRRLLLVTWLVLGMSMPRASLAADADVVAVAPASAPAPAPAAIPGSRAADYVGQEVTIEGRVAAIHESPLATVLAFAPNFAGFTATILAADRDKFPRDLDARVRDRLVRVSGTVTAYRGKPEMALRDPAQLILAPPPAPGSVAAHSGPAAVAMPDGALDDMRRTLGRIEARLESLESRMNALEAPPPGQEDEVVPEPRPQR